MAALATRDQAITRKLRGVGGCLSRGDVSAALVSGTVLPTNFNKPAAKCSFLGDVFEHVRPPS